MLDQIKESVKFLRGHGVTSPQIGLIIGTGLGEQMIKGITDPIVIDYKAIPHFPVATVESHKGRLIYGKVHGKNVLAMHGRFHYYEGYSMEQITLPVRVMKLLGVKYLLISNAAGN